jgi:hypothetical protein
VDKKQAEAKRIIVIRQTEDLFMRRWQAIAASLLLITDDYSITPVTRLIKFYSVYLPYTFISITKFAPFSAP